MSRAKFGEPIGMTDSEIKNVETGATQLKENKIPLICNTYNINEQWLRTGQGNMFLPKTRAQEIGEIVQNAATRDPEESMKFFTELLGDMTDAEIAIMYEVFRRHFPK